MEYKGFIGSVFDFSFTEFVTTRLIKVLFILAIIGAGFQSVVVLIGSFAGGPASALLGLILCPILFLVVVILSRVWLEVIIVMFRIAENTGRMANTCQATPVCAPSAQPETE